MDIELIVNNEVEKENNLLSNMVEQFIKMLKDSLKTIELKENLQKKYTQILGNDETIEYSVFSKVTGKDYTVLSFQSDVNNIIKVPNLFLPKEMNSRTVLNYKDGNFIINQEKTDLNNIKWSKEQEREEILKENRIYFIDSHRNDYTELIAVDNGEMYQFSYMEPYIGRRLKIDVNEGEYIIAKDGKFEKYNGDINISDEKTKTLIEKREQEIEKEKLNKKENLQEGKEFIVKEIINSDRIIVQSKDNGKETYMGLYTDITQLEDLQVRGVEDIYCYESNNATIENLKVGDNLITKNGKIIKQQTEEVVEDKKINQYIGKSGEIYIVNKVLDETIKITNVDSNKNLIIKKEAVNISEGDFIKTKDVGYEKYDGVVSLKDETIKDNIKILYDYII